MRAGSSTQPEISGGFYTQTKIHLRFHHESKKLLKWSLATSHTHCWISQEEQQKSSFSAASVSVVITCTTVKWGRWRRIRYTPSGLACFKVYCDFICACDKTIMCLHNLHKPRNLPHINFARSITAHVRIFQTFQRTGEACSSGASPYLWHTAGTSQRDFEQQFLPKPMSRQWVCSAGACCTALISAASRCPSLSASSRPGRIWKKVQMWARWPPEKVLGV